MAGYFRILSKYVTEEGEMSILVNDDDRMVFLQELKDRLPAQILDSHVHIRIPGDFPPAFSFPKGSCFGRFEELFTYKY